MVLYFCSPKHIWKGSPVILLHCKYICRSLVREPVCFWYFIFSLKKIFQLAYKVAGAPVTRFLLLSFSWPFSWFPPAPSPKLCLSLDSIPVVTIPTVLWSLASTHMHLHIDKHENETLSAFFNACLTNHCPDCLGTASFRSTCFTAVLMALAGRLFMPCQRSRECGNLAMKTVSEHIWHLSWDLFSCGSVLLAPPLTKPTHVCVP